MKLEPESRLQRVWKWVKSAILRTDRIPLFGLAILLYLLWTVWANQVSMFTNVSQLALTVGFVLLIFYDIRKKWDWSLWLLIMVVVLAIGILFSWAYWEFLHGKGDSPAGPTIRNLGLLIGGVIAAVLAFWRSKVAEDQANTAQRQADTAQQSLLNERYQKGAEMLGSETLSVRLGGIYALERLAAEHPDQYHIQTMKLFCAFVVQATQERREAELRDPLSPPRTTMDTQTIMFAICDRQEIGIRLERNSEVYLELGSAYLRGFDLRSVDLAGANLADANLADARLDEANLSSALLGGADLHGATLSSTNLSGAYFFLGRKNDEGVIDPNPVIGLTQSQLDQACVDADNPPIILEATDAETGHRLVWRGKPCKGE